MSDEEEIGGTESAETEQPRRRRRKLLDFVTHQPDEQEGDVAVDSADQNEPPKLLAPEPEAKGVIAAVAKMIGRGKTMKEGLWAGKPHWVCTKCDYDTLERDRARRHYC